MTKKTKKAWQVVYDTGRGTAIRQFSSYKEAKQFTKGRKRFRIRRGSSHTPPNYSLRKNPSSSTLMWVGGAALAALAVGGLYYAKSAAAAPATPAGNLLPGQVTTLTQGQTYTITALLPAGISDAPSLAAALKAAGWTKITVWGMSPGNLGSLNSMAVPAGAYVAQGTWGGVTGPAPVSVVVISGALSPAGINPLATA